MIELTPTQRYAKDVIEWLMNDDWTHRRTGRTTLMCIIFIEKAIKNTGTWINVWDHGPWHPKKDQSILENIIDIIIDKYPNYKYKVNIVNKCFLMEKK